MKCSFRDIKEDDIQTIVRLYKDMYKEQKSMGMIYNFNEEYIENLILAKIKSRLNINLIMEDENRKVIGMGICSLAKIPNKYILKDEKYIGFIEDLYIDKSYRNKYFGKLLFKEIENKFKELDVKYIELDVLNENETGKKFWQSVGFNNTIQRMYKKI